MKNKIILALLAICCLGASTEDQKSVFTTKDIVWYGLDFTKAKFVGGFDQAGGIGEVNGEDLVNKWIPSWNNLIVNEQKKFDLCKTFHKSTVFFDTKSVTALNAAIDPSNCMTPNPSPISVEDISKMAGKYSGEKKEGLGLAFVIDNFNKIAVSAEMYVVFFDIATKKVLLAEKVSGKPVGIGMRNYWAGAINSMMKQVREKEYKKWEKNQNK